VLTLAFVSDFAVVVPSLAQASSVTDSIGVDLAAELAQLRAVVGDVLSGGWGGAAATAFDQAWLSWQAGADDMVSALGRLAELLADAGREYAARDAVSSELLRRAAS
jgi:WXG100 family type VII secretion target